MLKRYNLENRAQVREGLRHLPQDVRQQVELTVAVASNGKKLPFIGRGCVKPLFRKCDDMEDIPGVVQKNQTFWSDFDSSCRSFEQPRIQFFFQRVNLVGYRRLRNIELSGRLCKAERFGHGQETGKLKCVYVSSLLIIDKSSLWVITYFELTIKRKLV